MTRIASIAISSLLLLGLTAFVPSISAAPWTPAQTAPTEQPGVPTPDQQLTVLTAKLDLTTEQQAKIRPVLTQLDDLQVKLMADQTLTQEERFDRIRPARYKAADQIRAVLTGDQKPKFEAYLAGPHPEMHGNLNASQPPQE